MRTDLRRQLQMHVERHGTRPNLLNRPASVIAAAHSRERMFATLPQSNLQSFIELRVRLGKKESRSIFSEF